MAKYHNSPNGPRICASTKGKCPYALAGKPHFDTQIEAQKAYEEKMQESFGVATKLKRSGVEKLRQASYRKVDKVTDHVKTVAASPAGRKTVKTLKKVKELAAALGDKRRMGELRAKLRASLETQVHALRTAAKTRATLTERGSVHAASVSQRNQRAHLSKLRDAVERPYSKPKTLRADEVKVGDRLDSKEIVIETESSSRGTLLTLQSADGARMFRVIRMNNGEPIRAAKPRNDSVSRTLKKSEQFITTMKTRVATASIQQREVLNTLRGVQEKQRVQTAYRLPTRSGGTRDGGAPGSAAYRLPTRPSSPIRPVNDAEFAAVAEGVNLRNVVRGKHYAESIPQR